METLDSITSKFIHFAILYLSITCAGLFLVQCIFRSPLGHYLLNKTPSTYQEWLALHMFSQSPILVAGVSLIITIKVLLARKF